MFSGFDFGTSNCAMGVMEEVGEGSDVKLLPIGQGKAFMPSVLYALRSEIICESVANQLQDKATQLDFSQRREKQLAYARRIRNAEDIDSSEKFVLVGQEALDQYLDLPSEGYFVKNIKSFLGADGLREGTAEFFEDIVTAMMLDIKQRAEQQLGKSIEHTVIGRPVNFQGVNAKESNRRAIDILSISAKRAGFKTAEFLFEPLAAGLDLELQLTRDANVLVVDVGGGTTDCAMVRMGPSYYGKFDRESDFLGHSGERIGGNDFDIQLARKELMPLMGLHSPLKSGLPMPQAVFFTAIATNNIGEQLRFKSAEVGRQLEDVLINTTEPELFRRFIDMRDENKNHRVVRSAELAKIQLSSEEEHQVNLDYIEQALAKSINREQFAEAVQRPISAITALMEEAIKQAGTQPDLIYLTGGSGKSQVIRLAIEQRYSGIEVVDGDHFGSVAKGLTVWAEKLFGAEKS